jgi:protein-disulfide isomerase
MTFPSCGRTQCAALLITLLAAGACTPPDGASSSGSGAGETAAEFGDTRITVSELDEQIRENLFTEATQGGDAAATYELRSGALGLMIDERLLSAEAEKRGVEVDEMLASEAEQAGPVEFAEVRAFYDEVKDRLQDVAFDDVADQIRARLEQQRDAASRAALLASLREAASVKVSLEPPRIDITANGPAIGPENAPVTIVEFSDYQCPFCKRAEPTLQQIALRYPDQVRIVYRHFPLDSIHPLARPAAEAAACAEEQGKFWEFHSLVWEATPDLGPEKLSEMAASLELDADAFGACVEERRFQARVQLDLDEGQAAGVNGTPAFFVNGIPLSGARSLDDFVQVIESELARLGSEPAAS